MNQKRGKKLGAIFVELGVLDADQEIAALAYAKKNAIPFGQACVQMGFIDEPTVVKGLSMQLGAPSVSLSGISVSNEVRKLIPARLAEKERVVPVSVIPPAAGARVATLVVAISTPKNLMEMDELSFMTGHRISPVIASDSDIDSALMTVYGIDVHRNSRSANMVELESQPEIVMGTHDELPSGDSLSLAMDFLPTIDITRDVSR